MANITNKIFVDKMGGTSSANFIGQPGDIFYDPTVGDLRISDGVTVGGKSISGEQNAGVYRGYQAGVNFFRNTNDQDIAQVIIHNAQGRVDYINYTTDTDNDDFYVTNLNQADQDNGGGAADRVIVLNIYGATISDKTPILSPSDVRTFVRKFIDLVLFDENDNSRNLGEAKDAFYANFTELAGSLPDGTLFENFSFNDDRRVHWPEYNTPEGVTQYADFKYFLHVRSSTNRNYSSRVRLHRRTSGSGWSVGQHFTINGGQLGGVDGINDMTVTVESLKSGNILSLSITDGGSGHTPTGYVNPSDSETLSGGNGYNAEFFITECDENGTITQFEMVNDGANYQVGDELTYGNATFTVNTVGTDAIDSVSYTGTLYNDSPALIPSGYWPNMYINDGLDDQYDDGNWISTDVSSSIVKADLAGKKITINSFTKEGFPITPGMVVTLKDDDSRIYQGILINQANGNSSVWFMDNDWGITTTDITLRIDGLPYNYGNIYTANDTFKVGNNSDYVVVYNQSIFAMIAFTDTEAVNSVYYNGNIGADGGGYKEVSTLLGSRTVDYTVKSVPQTYLFNTEYDLQPSDAGRHIYYNSGGQNTVYLSSSTSEAYPVGTAITIVSGGDGWTYIRPSDDSVKIWGAGFNGTSNWWYIPANSIATLLKIAENKWMLSGVGLGDDT